jgi:hypothetical protein
MFASKSIVEHLIRGALGLGAFALASALAPAHPLLALAMVPVGFVALRGCPTCWTVGLVQTVAARIQGKPTAAPCTDGSCVLARPRGDAAP